MKLSLKNIFASKVLVWDPAKSLEIFPYDCDINTTRVLISGKPELTLRHFSDHCNIVPFEFKTEQCFNNLVLRALLKACEINENIISSLKDVKKHFITQNMPLLHALIPDNDYFIKKHYKELYEMLGNDHYNLIKTIGMRCNQILFLPDPEWLGVISVSGDNLDKYGVGIINSNGPLLVKLNLP